MTLKYKFNLKDIKLEDFKIYLFSLLKAFIPKKKIKNIKDLTEFIQKKIIMGFPGYIIWLPKNKDGNKICFNV